MEAPATFLSSPFLFDVSTNGRATHLRLSGELDMAGVPALTEQLDGLPAGASIIIDLRGLTFMDATGLSALLAFAGEERTCGFVAGPRNVQRVFEITGTADRLNWVAAKS